MNAVDNAFILICAGLVFMMTPALALFYGGLVRSRNVLSTSMHSYACLAVGTVLWFFVGYSLAFGPDQGGLIGDFSFVLFEGVSGTTAPAASNLPHETFAMFQCMFACLTMALISGAYAERIRFRGMLLFSALWLIFCYAPMAHWVWGGGWMAKMGAIDFAGGAVVHMASAAAALACAHALGPRLDSVAAAFCGLAGSASTQAQPWQPTALLPMPLPPRTLLLPSVSAAGYWWNGCAQASPPPLVQLPVPWQALWPSHLQQVSSPLVLPPSWALSVACAATAASC